jgi:hypothetical protein
MKSFIFRILRAAVYFALNFTAWYIIPSYFLTFMRLELISLSTLFYFATLISTVSALSAFYKDQKLGIVFSITYDLAVIGYILYFGGGGIISTKLEGISITLDIRLLLLVLLLPIVVSIVGKVWKIATMVAEERLETYEVV